MPLHPQARAFLDAMQAAGVAPLGTLSPEEHRAAGKARRVPPRRPEAVHHVEDRAVPGPAGEIPVRVYRPSDEDGLPLVVYFHAGGWTIGDLDGPDLSLRKVANRTPCVVVSVDYRLAPEHRFPAAVEDAWAATLWAHEHAFELDADAERVAVAGESAGGNLAAVVALLARDAGGPALRQQTMLYAVTNHSFDTPSYAENAEGYLLTKSGMEWFWKQYLGADGDGNDWRASPLRAPSLEGLPPAHIVTAEFDPLRDEGEAYAARLRDAGIEVRCTRYEGQMHSFVTHHELIDDGERAIDEVVEELRRAFAQR
jgi:acetyl esterase